MLFVRAEVVININAVVRRFDSQGQPWWKRIAMEAQARFDDLLRDMRGEAPSYRRGNRMTDLVDEVRQVLGETGHEG